MWTEKNVESTGKSPHFSRSTVHGPRPHFIDTPGALQASFDNAAQNPENRIFLKTITINLATTNTIHLYFYFFYPLHHFP